MMLVEMGTQEGLTAPAAGCCRACLGQAVAGETGTSGQESPRPEVKITASSGELHPRSDCTLNPSQHRAGRSGSQQERAPRCLGESGLGQRSAF